MRQHSAPTIGQRFADIIANGVGSWTFIIVQSLFLATWITLNANGSVEFDAYPFTLLNLFLSFQAAYTAPFILMSQGRQAAIDRATLEADLDANQEELVMLERIEIRLSTIIEERLSTLIEELHTSKK